MEILIRESDISKDKNLIMEILRELSKEAADYPEAKFNLMYENNPYGKARVWLAFDKAKDRLIGMHTAFPRRVTVKDDDILMCNLGDNYVIKEYRTLGAAIKLGRAPIDAIKDGEFPFFYAEPNTMALVQHLKVGSRVIGKSLRFARMLKVDYKTKEYFGDNPFSKMINKAGNLYIHTLYKNKFFKPHHEINIEERPKFSADFDKLYERVVGTYPISGVRDSTYLNWRFGKYYYHTPYCLTVREGSELIGYIIFLLQDKFLFIHDIFCKKNFADYRIMLEALVEKTDAEKINSLSISTIEESPLIPALKSLLFYPRPPFDHTCVVYAKRNSDLYGFLMNGKNWFITASDYDSC